MRGPLAGGEVGEVTRAWSSRALQATRRTLAFSLRDVTTAEIRAEKG